MRFSELFEILDADDYEWFDPHLNIDTPLFVDPFLIFEDDEERWKHCHDKIMDYFQSAFKLLAQSGMQKTHQFYRRVVELMIFPEPKEFRLGFSSEKIEGLGTGRELARLIVEAMSEAVKRGIEDIKHFEELGVLVEGIDKDRISDITCNLLKPDLISYTQEVCLALGIALEDVEVAHSKYSDTRKRWMKSSCALPVDPRTGVPIILVPKKFLRELPTLSSSAWKEFLDSSLRDDLNLRISERMNKAEIVSLARRSPDAVKEWVEWAEANGSVGYDFKNDPQLNVGWYEGAKKLVTTEPVSRREISDPGELYEFVDEILEKFRHYIEEQGGWRLLWNSSRSKSVPELNIQLLMKGVMEGYCEAAGVALDREVELGRGPVDFVLTSSRTVRTLIEVKKLENG